MSFGFMLFAQFTTAKDKQPRSGYDEKEIMKKQADRYTAKRDYERANTILRELMEKYPDDWELVEKLLTNLMRVSKFDETEELQIGRAHV